MERIPFPSFYRQAISNKSKNITLRLVNEVDKYKEGNVYLATSYTGKDWGIKIRVKKVTPTKLGKLFEFGIPKRSIKALLNKREITPDSRVDIVEFEAV